MQIMMPLRLNGFKCPGPTLILLASAMLGEHQLRSQNSACSIACVLPTWQASAKDKLQTRPKCLERASNDLNAARSDICLGYRSPEWLGGNP